MVVVATALIAFLSSCESCLIFFFKRMSDGYLLFFMSKSVFVCSLICFMSFVGLCRWFFSFMTPFFVCSNSVVYWLCFSLLFILAFSSLIFLFFFVLTISAHCSVFIMCPLYPLWIWCVCVCIYHDTFLKLLPQSKLQLYIYT
jgi:hypothetical protein